MSEPLKISREVRDRESHELLGWIVSDDGFVGTHYSAQHPVVGRLDFPWAAVSDHGAVSYAIGCCKETQLSLIRKCPGFVEFKPTV